MDCGLKPERYGFAVEYKVCACFRDTTVVEWYFRCNYEGNVAGFDRVIIAEFNAEMKICDLKEFQSMGEHYYQYGDNVLLGKMLEYVKKLIVRCYSMCYIKNGGKTYDF